MNGWRSRGIKLMLDFVPNHTAPDHPWVRSASRLLRARRRGRCCRSRRRTTCGSSRAGALILAYGRDPYFPGWPDTLQLNYANPALQKAQIDELIGDRRQVRRRSLRHGDAGTARRLPAHLGRHAGAVLAEGDGGGARANPGFTFMAEVYWDLEWTLQQQGFDYCYDKRLYDRLRMRRRPPVREHLHAGLDYQDKLARFLENHDEPRAAADFPWPQHQAAAVITFLSPGLRFFHQGQFEGARVRVPCIFVAARSSPQIRRSPLSMPSFCRC